jgi:hypothetical protein
MTLSMFANGGNENLDSVGEAAAPAAVSRVYPASNGCPRVPAPYCYHTSLIGKNQAPDLMRNILE